MNIEFYNKLKKLSDAIEVELDSDECNKFYEYMNVLLEWNEKMNLTAITEEDEVILKHFIDSLTILKYIKENDTIIDVGTGAGFPGIPIAIKQKSNNITLLDSLNKRITFLNEVTTKLELENVKTVHGRAEDYGKDKDCREKFDISVSRAVANLATLSEYLLPFVKVGGRAICMKGPDCDDEIENAQKAIKELGGQIEKIEKFKLPNSDIERTIIILKKVKSTPNKYPRKAGVPSKEPIHV